MQAEVLTKVIKKASERVASQILRSAREVGAPKIRAEWPLSWLLRQKITGILTAQRWWTGHADPARPYEVNWSTLPVSRFIRTYPDLGGPWRTGEGHLGNLIRVSDCARSPRSRKGLRGEVKKSDVSVGEIAGSTDRDNQIGRYLAHTGVVLAS